MFIVEKENSDILVKYMKCRKREKRPTSEEKLVRLTAVG